MRRRRLSRGATAVALLLAVAPPDVLLPGERSVDHRLAFTVAATASTHTYALSPTRGFGGVVVLTEGTETNFSTKYGSRVYALPSDATVPEEPAAVADLQAASSPPPVYEIRGAPAWTLLARVRTQVLIEGVRDGAVQMRVLGETRHDDFGLPMVLGVSPTAAALAAAGVALVWWLVRRRKRRRAA